jgi:hypothetical protein
MPAPRWVFVGLQTEGLLDAPDEGDQLNGATLVKSSISARRIVSLRLTPSIADYSSAKVTLSSG